MSDYSDKKKIVLRDGAPPLEHLHMELRVRARFDYRPADYAYEPDAEGEVMGTHIGRTVSDLLDAVNEERLIQVNGEAGLDEHLGIWDRYIAETGADLQDKANTEDEVIRWEMVLCDKDGTIWSELSSTAGPENPAPVVADIGT